MAKHRAEDTHDGKSTSERNGAIPGYLERHKNGRHAAQETTPMDDRDYHGNQPNIGGK